MKTFKIGDRVRVKWSDNFPEAVGKEFVITATALYKQGDLGVVKGFAFVGDVWYQLSPDIDYGYKRFAPLAKQLEPAISPGEAQFLARVTEWADGKGIDAEVKRERVAQ